MSDRSCKLCGLVESYPNMLTSPGFCRVSDKCRVRVLERENSELREQLAKQAEVALQLVLGDCCPLCAMPLHGADIGDHWWSFCPSTHRHLEPLIQP